MKKLLIIFFLLIPTLCLADSYSGVTMAGVSQTAGNHYLVTPSIGTSCGATSINPNTAQSVLSGGTQAVTATLDTGCSEGTWGGTCGGSLSTDTYTTSAVTANCTVIANFASSCNDSSCSGFDICQNFEGTGYDNSETWTVDTKTGGTVDPDDTTATILRGSQQLKILMGTSGAPFARHSFTSASEKWLHFMFKFSGTVGNGTVLARLSNTAGGILQADVELDATKHPKVYHGSASATSSSTITAGTLYHFWLHYLAGSGSNGVADMYWGTDPVRANNEHLTITTGTSTANVAYLDLTDDNATHANFYDQVLIRSAEITNVCTP